MVLKECLLKHGSFILKLYLEMSNFKMWFTYRCVWVFKDLSRGNQYWINAKMWWERIREDCEVNRSMWGGQGVACPPDFSSPKEAAFILPSRACGRLRAQVGICSKKETCQNLLEEPLKKHLYLAASGLSCGTWDSQHWLVVCGFSACSCPSGGILVCNVKN